METKSQEAIETLVHDLIFLPWSDDGEEKLRAHLMVQTINPSSSLPKANKIDAIVEAIGEASNIRNEIENHASNMDDSWKDHLAKMHEMIMSDLRESFVF